MIQHKIVVDRLEEKDKFQKKKIHGLECKVTQLKAEA